MSESNQEVSVEQAALAARCWFNGHGQSTPAKYRKPALSLLDQAKLKSILTSFKVATPETCPKVGPSYGNF